MGWFQGAEFILAAMKNELAKGASAEDAIRFLEDGIALARMTEQERGATTEVRDA